MNKLIIAGVDPGGTTGLAIAEVTVLDRKLVLKQKQLLSLTDPQDVVTQIYHSKTYSLFVEKRVKLPSSDAGIVPYETILQGLINLGYEANKSGFRISPQGIGLVTPGTWKPVMEQQDIDRGHWYPSSPHEKDALNLLHYGLRINYIKKRIQYE